LARATSNDIPAALPSVPMETVTAEPTTNARKNLFLADERKEISLVESYKKGMVKGRKLAEKDKEWREEKGERGRMKEKRKGCSQKKKGENIPVTLQQKM
jgi:hypothetical protein